MAQRPDTGSLGVTMDDVARHAQVSRATVSRVLAHSQLVAPATRIRVFEAIDELGYVPNMVAQQLASQSTNTVGLLLRDPRNPAYGLLHSELQAGTDALGMHLVTVIPSRLQDGFFEVEGLRRLVGLRVGGLFVATGVLRSEFLEPFVSQIPVVSVGRPEYSPRVHAVSYDEVDNAHQLADAVIEAGHRKVAVLVTSDAVSLSENLRSLVIMDRLRASGVEVTGPEADEFGTMIQRHDELIGLVKARAVTAVMFPSDSRMHPFMDRLAAEGLRAPDDVSVTGCDAIMPGIDQLGYASLRIPIEKVAKRATELMRALLLDNTVEVQHEVHRGTYVPGRTLGAPNPTS